MSQSVRFFMHALDPIHVGTGGYRLGRVDLPIQRDPATNLPKIPGTGLEGCARAFAAMRSVPPRLRCAGQGQSDPNIPDSDHCGRKDCHVCLTFGFSKKNGGQGSSRKGIAHFYDAQLLFAPVYSRLGTVWVTSPLMLEAAAPVPTMETTSGILVSPTLFPEKHQRKNDLNLGWVKLQVAGSLTQEQVEGLADATHCAKKADADANKRLRIVLSRLVVVPDQLVSHIVNANLEVRTSVSINPKTGAAKEGALFTYEAVPRGAWFVADIVYTDPELFNTGNGFNRLQAEAVVDGALEYFKFFGVGGMNTRGFGRLEVWKSGRNHSIA